MTVEERLAILQEEAIEKYKHWKRPFGAFLSFEDLKEYVNANQRPRVGLFDPSRMEVSGQVVPETTALIYMVHHLPCTDIDDKLVSSIQIPKLDTPKRFHPNLFGSTQHTDPNDICKPYHFPAWIQSWRGTSTVYVGSDKDLPPSKIVWKKRTLWSACLLDSRMCGLVDKGMISDGALFSRKEDAELYAGS